MMTNFYITNIKHKTGYFPDNRTSIAGVATTGTAVSPHRLHAERTKTNPGGSCGGPRRSRSGVRRCKATSTRRWNDCGRAPSTGLREATQVCPITTWRQKSFVLKNIFGGHQSFFWGTYTFVLDFWACFN